MQIGPIGYFVIRHAYAIAVAYIAVLLLIAIAADWIAPASPFRGAVEVSPQRN